MEKNINIEDADRGWRFPMVVPVALPVGLSHLESPDCWCGPLIETDELGDETVLHRHVTWN